MASAQEGEDEDCGRGEKHGLQLQLVLNERSHDVREEAGICTNENQINMQTQYSLLLKF